VPRCVSVMVAQPVNVRIMVVIIRIKKVFMSISFLGYFIVPWELETWFPWLMMDNTCLL